MRVAHIAFVVFACIIGLLGFVVRSWSYASVRVPTVGDIQAAYEVEAGKSRSLHLQGLTVVSAECAGAEQGSYLCWIKYRSGIVGEDELRFDVVTLDNQSSIWKLTSGLCIPAASQ